MLLYVHGDPIKDCWGRWAQDGHPDFHTAPDLLQSGRIAYDSFCIWQVCLRQFLYLVGLPTTVSVSGRFAYDSFCIW